MISVRAELATDRPVILDVSVEANEGRREVSNAGTNIFA